MLEVKSDNSIYLTKGDSGILNITVTGDDVSALTLKFTVRNAQNLDNEMFSITQGEVIPVDQVVYGVIDHTPGSNTWTLRIYKAATSSMKRKKYYYDFSLENTAETSGDKTTFVGGGQVKTEFWVT